MTSAHRILSRLTGLLALAVGLGLACGGAAGQPAPAAKAPAPEQPPAAANELEVIALKFASAQDAAKHIWEVFGLKGGNGSASVSFDTRTNSVIVLMPRD